MNIILITVDCLRKDYVGCYNPSVKKYTPNIDMLAQESVVYNNAFATGPRTSVSFPGILGSQYRSLTQAKGKIDNNTLTLARFLAKNGFFTAAFHSNPFLSRAYGYDNGFSIFYDSVSATPKSSTLKRRVRDKLPRGRIFNFLRALNNTVFGATGDLFRRANFINEKAIDFMEKNRDTQFFLWLHYMDVHYPYTPPVTFRIPNVSERKINKLMTIMLSSPNKITDHEHEIIKNLYLSEIYYFDYEFKSLLDFLKHKGIYDDSIIILTSDHGEEFREHGHYSHAAAYESKFAIKLFDELLRVPLLVKLPDSTKREVNDLTSLLDLGPLLCSHLGLGIPKRWNGQAGTREYIIAEHIMETDKKNIFATAVRNNDSKLIWDHVDAEHQFYNLKDDPKEEENLYNKTEVDGGLKRALEDHIRLVSAQREKRRLQYASQSLKRKKKARRSGETRQG
ncbi:MAG: sulfatase [Chloroflexota bacterium]